MGEGLQDNFIASADESHAIPFVEVKPTPDRPGQGDLAATPDLADNHRSILDFSDYPPSVIVTGTLDYTCAKQKWRPVKIPLIPINTFANFVGRRVSPAILGPGGDGLGPTGAWRGG
ncbi:MAG: hypothetical protein M5U01_40590 [Ardenticatenaceae bacterium]|nr:hypothetical protein [Ardenticatenaceae bacterium]